MLILPKAACFAGSTSARLRDGILPVSGCYRRKKLIRYFKMLWGLGWLLAGAGSLSLADPADTLPVNDPVPGGTAVVPLALPDGENDEVYFGAHRIAVNRHQGQWYGIVGIPDNQRPGKYILVVRPADGNEFTIPFQVTPASNSPPVTLVVPASLKSSRGSHSIGPPPTLANVDPQQANSALSDVSASQSKPTD